MAVILNPVPGDPRSPHFVCLSFLYTLGFRSRAAASVQLELTSDMAVLSGGRFDMGF